MKVYPYKITRQKGLVATRLCKHLSKTSKVASICHNLQQLQLSVKNVQFDMMFKKISDKLANMARFYYASASNMYKTGFLFHNLL